MSREDWILEAAFGIVATFLFLIAVLTTLGFSSTAAAWVQAIGSVAAIIAAIVVFRLQNLAALSAERRAANERARFVRNCIAAEFDLLLGALRPILGWQENGLGALPALSTLGTLQVRVYHRIIPQLGALPSELVADVVSRYAELEHLIQRGQEVDRITTTEADALDWLGSLQRVAANMSETLIELRAPAHHEQG